MAAWWPVRRRPKSARRTGQTPQRISDPEHAVAHETLFRITGSKLSSWVHEGSKRDEPRHTLECDLGNTAQRYDNTDDPRYGRDKPCRHGLALDMRES